jgi:hypothetical protein
MSDRGVLICTVANIPGGTWWRTVRIRRHSSESPLGVRLNQRNLTVTERPETTRPWPIESHDGWMANSLTGEAKKKAGYLPCFLIFWPASLTVWPTFFAASLPLSRRHESGTVNRWFLTMPRKPPAPKPGKGAG